MIKVLDVDLTVDALPLSPHANSHKLPAYQTVVTEYSILARLAIMVLAVPLHVLVVLASIPLSHQFIVLVSVVMEYMTMVRSAMVDPDVPPAASALLAGRLPALLEQLTVNLSVVMEELILVNHVMVESIASIVLVWQGRNQLLEALAAHKQVLVVTVK